LIEHFRLGVQDRAASNLHPVYRDFRSPPAIWCRRTVRTAQNSCSASQCW
jgi:hypothetical protein